MPNNEKEYNGYLLDQLASLERIEEIAIASGCKDVIAAIEKEKKWVERKLYQTPPIGNHEK